MSLPFFFFKGNSVPRALPVLQGATSLQNPSGVVGYSGVWHSGEVTPVSSLGPVCISALSHTPVPVSSGAGALSHTHGSILGVVLAAQAQLLSKREHPSSSTGPLVGGTRS